MIDKNIFFLLSMVYIAVYYHIVPPYNSITGILRLFKFNNLKIRILCLCDFFEITKGFLLNV